MSTLSHAGWGRDVWATYRIWCYRQTQISNLHDHTFYELFWVVEGQGRYFINGNEESLKAGDLVLVRPEDRHAFAAAKAGEFMEFVNVTFLPEMWPDLERRYFRGRRVYFGLKDYRARRYRLSPSQISRLGALSGNLRVGGRNRLAIESFVSGLLSMLEEPDESDNASGIPQWLALAREQIRLAPNFAGGPAAFVRLAGRSPEHVARECRKRLGRPPSELVNEARMEFSAKELSGGHKAIVDIALECGIENLGHFYQLFKKQYGVSPAKYRKQKQVPMHFV